MKAKANSQQLFGTIYLLHVNNAVSLPLHCKKISINVCVLWLKILMVECLHPMFEKASQWLLQLTQAESGSTIASSEPIAGG